MEGLALFSDDEVLEAISQAKGDRVAEKPVKQLELDSLLAAPDGLAMMCRSIPTFTPAICRTALGQHSPLSDGIESVIQVHRLREVLALVG